MQGPRRAVEPGVAVIEDAAVGRHEPVAALARHGGHADDGLVQGEAARAAAEVLAEREDASVGGDRQVSAQRAGRSLAGPEWIAAADEPAQRRVVVELGPSACLDGVERARAGHLEVLHDALHVAAPDGSRSTRPR